ncbi:hypothetical protein TNCV_3280601 [Trichonephila clavipes]|nr:hypothetical protein TNCV_3280601 [Trichonephila clavipes]
MPQALGSFITPMLRNETSYWAAREVILTLKPGLSNPSGKLTKQNGRTNAQESSHQRVCETFYPSSKGIPADFSSGADKNEKIQKNI